MFIERFYFFGHEVTEILPVTNKKKWYFSKFVARQSMGTLYMTAVVYVQINREKLV